MKHTASPIRTPTQQYIRVAIINVHALVFKYLKRGQTADLNGVFRGIRTDQLVLCYPCEEARCDFMYPSSPDGLAVSTWCWESNLCES